MMIRFAGTAKHEGVIYQVSGMFELDVDVQKIDDDHGMEITIPVSQQYLVWLDELLSKDLVCELLDCHFIGKGKGYTHEIWGKFRACALDHLRSDGEVRGVRLIETR
jgi:hypothetical protein